MRTAFFAAAWFVAAAALVWFVVAAVRVLALATQTAEALRAALEEIEPHLALASFPRETPRGSRVRVH